MDLSDLANTLASILFVSVPLIYATLGETLTERAGVIHLSLNGTILLTAMAGFAATSLAGPLFPNSPDAQLLVGFGVAALVGALVAAVVAFAGITLRRDQVAVGFVLTLLCADLSSFLGDPFVRLQGVPFVPHVAIPVLSDIPFIGTIFFDHDLLTYFSLLLILVVWFWMYKTRAGLVLQGIGEQPRAAYARGASVNALRYVYTLLGGALVGISGAAFSLDIKTGWSQGMTAGTGWIALSIVIFGGWNPLRTALGAYLFGALSYLAIVLQKTYPGAPTEVFTVAPFPVMILALLLTNSEGVDRLVAYLPPRFRYRVRAAIRSTAPAALGTTFEKG